MSNTAPAGFFSPKINEFDGASKYPWFPVGFQGRIKVAACKGITTRKGDRAFIAEVDVLSSNLQEVQVGGRYSWYQKLTEEGTAWPAVLSFLYACLGLDMGRDKAKIEAEIKPKQNLWLNQAINDDPKQGKVQILAGQELLLQTSNKPKKDGSPFTLHTFTALPKAA